MTVLATFTKQPVEELDYDFDYSAFLSTTDTVVSAVITVEPVEEGGITVSGTVVEPTYVKAWLAGGKVGTTYKITCTATTEHRVKQDEIKIRVREY